MSSRVIRVTLMLLAFSAAGAASYFHWTTRERINAELGHAAAFAHARAAATRAAFDLRSAQQAYVAAGQNEAFWFQKVSDSIESLRAAVAGLEGATASAQARASLAEISATLQDFEEGDRRVRGYVSSGQKLLASDIIFSDGFERIERILMELDRGANLAEQESASVRAAASREQIIAAGGAVGVALLVVLLLTPLANGPVSASEPAAAAPQPAETPLGLELRTETPAARKEPAAVAKPTPPAPSPKPALNLASLARVCNDLARLSDTAAVPAILERAALALDASGLVVWIADDGRKELMPIAAHGYPPSVLSKMGTLSADAENATAAAFRTSLVQTVRAGGTSNGAIAAPLVSPSGCLGVMSVEVRNGGEKQPERLAAASIVAAQLATIVGPPAVRAEEQNSAAL